MTHQIYPCLWFDGQAKAAADFYCSVFKNSKITSNNPMLATFEIEGQKFMGLNGAPLFKINPSISFFFCVPQQWKWKKNGICYQKMV